MKCEKLDEPFLVVGVTVTNMQNYQPIKDSVRTYI